MRAVFLSESDSLPTGHCHEPSRSQNEQVFGLCFRLTFVVLSLGARFASRSPKLLEFSCLSLLRSSRAKGVLGRERLNPVPASCGCQANKFGRICQRKQFNYLTVFGRP